MSNYNGDFGKYFLYIYDSNKSKCFCIFDSYINECPSSKSIYNCEKTPSMKTFFGRNLAEILVRILIFNKYKICLINTRYLQLGFIVTIYSKYKIF